MTIFTEKYIAELRELAAKVNESPPEVFSYGWERQHALRLLVYKKAAVNTLPAALNHIEQLREAGDKLAEYVDLLARKGDDITTTELEGALNAFSQWHSLKGGEGFATITKAVQNSGA